MPTCEQRPVTHGAQDRITGKDVDVKNMGRALETARRGRGRPVSGGARVGGRGQAAVNGHDRAWILARRKRIAEHARNAADRLRVIESMEKSLGLEAPIRVDVTHQGNVGVQTMAGVLHIEDPLQFARIMEAVRAKREAVGKAVEAEVEGGGAARDRAGAVTGREGIPFLTVWRSRLYAATRTSRERAAA